MTAPLRLHYAPDNASLILRLALEELGLDYEAVLVDRKTQGQTAPHYLRMNPNGTIPVLETPDGAMFETAAILLWLADRERRLMPPPEAPARGRCLTWLFWCSNTLHIDLRQSFYPEKYIGDDRAHQAQLRAMLRGRLQNDLRMIDTALRQAPALVAAAISRRCLTSTCPVCCDGPNSTPTRPRHPGSTSPPTPPCCMSANGPRPAPAPMRRNAPKG